MPYQEKSAWVSLATTFTAYALYFAILIPRLVADPRAPEYGLLIGTVILLIVLQIVLQTAIAILSRGDASQPRDERERLIGLKSDRIALGVLSTAIGGLFVIYVFAPGIPGTTTIAANAILLSLVLSALAKFGSVIVYFRGRV
jgi:hypothetical protein